MKTTLTSLLLLLATAALAVPAKRVKRLITLPDGTTAEAVLAGDEFAHYYQIADGSKYIEAQSGQFRKAPEALLREGSARRAQANQRRTAPRRANWGANSNPVSGKKRGIVLLVSFADKAMKNTQSEYDKYFNQVGYNRAGMTGSVHDYFYKSSYGQFDLEFDVVGPLTVSKNMAYYGENDAEGSDKHPAEMVCEAVRLADKTGVDFSQYDWDGDGLVDQVYVVFAGYGESQGSAANTIWPHEYELASAGYFGDGDGPITLDGVTINTYATSCEFRGTSGQVIDGIGTACHEFSHCMAIPDFYDVKQSGCFGMDVWDLMDYGCYQGVNGNGESPYEYTSYERMYCGWLTPVELAKGETVEDMQPLETTPEAYIIYNDNNRNEFYMLENRQGIDFDTYAYGHGMVVLHVDFDSQTWVNNTVNTSSSRQRMTIIPADNNLKSASEGYSYVAGDPFPGTKDRTELTNTSTPKARLNTKNTDGSLLMNKPITNISETDGLISFLFMGGRLLDTPEATVDEVADSAFTLSWAPVDRATSYELMLTSNDGDTSDPSDFLLLTEDFAKFGAGAAGSTDIAAKLDNYTTLPGWSGSKIYTTAHNGAKVGSSASKGFLQTPTIATEGGYISLSLHLAPYGSDKPKIGLFIGESTQAFDTIQVVADTVVNLSFLATGDFRLKVQPIASSQHRFYITDLSLYEGKFDQLPRRARQTTTFTTDETSYTFAGLNPAYGYECTVRATDGKVYSPWSTPQCVTFLQTGLAQVKSQHWGENACFDLSGRRLTTAPAKGIYVVGGKKVIK